MTLVKRVEKFYLELDQQVGDISEKLKRPRLRAKAYWDGYNDKAIESLNRLRQILRGYL